MGGGGVAGCIVGGKNSYPSGQELARRKVG